MTSVFVDQRAANRMVEQAINFCAEKKFSGQTEPTLLALRQGRCDICSYVSESLVKQVGEYLGKMDRSVKAVYQFEPELSALRPKMNKFQGRGGVNLIAWVDRKSPALEVLSGTLESVLAESRRKFGCKNATAACYTLDVKMVDDKDVLEKRGYGALISSMYVRSTLIWTRREPSPIPAKGILDDLKFITFDAELAPEHTLFDQAHAILNLPPEEQEGLNYRLSELKVVLIRKMISDQLAYINIAKDWLSFDDLEEIYRRKIGNGKIGGKSAGMILAARILQEIGDDTIRSQIKIPESYFLGSDVMYIFMAMNGLLHWNDQKYKPEDQIRAEFPQICEEFEQGQFPPEILKNLKELLDNIGTQPLIVRSSSQLEDNFGTSFAGKYNSYFCPNQSLPDDNLQALVKAIIRTYASTFNPNALLYRRSKGLQDYDERMAVLIQVVQGEKFEHYFMPQGAGVAYSRNIYRWSPKIRREDGFVRLVWGLGTRAVERVGNDYPRLIALSHPTLHPDDNPEAIHRYSQQFVDVIDLQANQLKTLAVQEILEPKYPFLRYIAQLAEEGYLATPRSLIKKNDIHKLAITFDEFLRRTPFAPMMSQTLQILEENYHSAVDIEFTVKVLDLSAPNPKIEISLLQCRPQSHLQPAKVITIPKELSPTEIVFSTRFMVPQGYVANIRFVIFIVPEQYFKIPTEAERKRLVSYIEKLNRTLPDKSFICVGPGRWGTANPDLGVFVSYADICNAAALVELSGKGIGAGPEPSLGTHFFQDLMEAQIYPLAIPLDDEETLFNRDFFYNTPNSLSKWLPSPDAPDETLRLIDVNSIQEGCSINLAMDDERGRAVAYLTTK